MDETREKILKAAEGLFLRFGIRSITMDEIARHLAISKKTLYQHFTDKDAIVEAVMKIHLLHEWEQFELLRLASSNCMEELWKISEYLKEQLDRTNPTMLYDMQKFHTNAWAFWLEFKEKRIKNFMAESLLKGISEGNVRKEVNPEIVTIMRLSLIEISCSPELFPKDKFNQLEVQTQFFDLFVFGIATDSGKELYLKYKQKQTS